MKSKSHMITFSNSVHTVHPLIAFFVIWRMFLIRKWGVVGENMYSWLFEKHLLSVFYVLLHSI